MNDAPHGPDRVRDGIALLLLLHLLQVVWIADDVALFAYAGLTQLTYAVPAMVVLAVRRRWRTLLGLGIGVLLTFGVNALVVLWMGGGSVR